MLAHAASSPDIEVCGLLGGHEDRAVSVYPVKNIAQDQSCQFLMDPVQQIAAMRSMRERGEVFWGIYHSHPNSPAIPSTRDRKNAAYPDIFYFIISLSDKSTMIKCYYFDGENFQGVFIDQYV